MAYKDPKRRRAAIKDWELRHPEKMKASRRAYITKKRYGVTVDQIEALRKKQRKRCAGCRKQRTLVVDHCHKRKHVRGLLCHHCNVALGHVGDSPRLLRKLAQYLESNK